MAGLDQYRLLIFSQAPLSIVSVCRAADSYRPAAKKAHPPLGTSGRRCFCAATFSGGGSGMQLRQLFGAELDDRAVLDDLLVLRRQLLDGLELKLEVVIEAAVVVVKQEGERQADFG